MNSTRKIKIKRILKRLDGKLVLKPRPIPKSLSPEEIKKLIEGSVKVAETKLNTRLANLKPEVKTEFKTETIIKPEVRTETIREVITKELDTKKLDELQREVDYLAKLGGGSMNRQMLIDGANPLTKYTDINYVSGNNITITAASDDSKRRTNITIAGVLGQAALNLKQNRALAISTKTTTYTITLADDTILADATSGSFVINLPTASSASGLIFVIKKIDSTGNTVTIDASGAELIDGQTTQTLDAALEAIRIQSDGTAWWIIGSY